MKPTVPTWTQFFGIMSFIVLAFGAPSTKAANRPNIIFILADDLGARDLGCYGSTYNKTPHLDRLAARGMKFTDAYAAAPVCSPTRAAILTGKYPARLNLTDWLPGRPDRPDQKLLRPAINQQLPLDEMTLAKVLKASGYTTAHVGKWHLGGPGFEPQRQGFDINIAGDQTGSPRNYFAPFKGRDGRFMPGLEKATEGEYLTDRLTTEAEKIIEQNKEKPFLLYLAHYAVHIPMRAKADLIAKYAKDLPAGRQNNPVYAAMVESLDDSVGRIAKKLDQLKLTDKTIVFFTSDNGGLCTSEGPNTPATINAPLREGKGYLYEGGLRVPLIVAGPTGVRPGSVNQDPVCAIDMLPTIASLCDAKLNAPVDGVNFLVGRPDGKPRELCWHYPHYSNQGGRPGGAIRAGGYKLIEFFEDGRRELFDLANDPGEGRNLIEEKGDLAKEMTERLQAWRLGVGARMMKPNLEFVANPQAANGIVLLPARTAEIHGLQVRYEPLPHKNTLGFWVRLEDWVSWDFTIVKPGSFTVEILQGCGKGQGGSQVEFTVADQTLSTTVEDTGHFQNFKPRELGVVKFENPGRYTLSVRPKSKPGVAVMDLRSVTLKPVSK